MRSVAGKQSEDGARSALAKQIQQDFGLKSTLPKMGDVIEL